ncbi:hypothetical protein [Pseudalkalibacillus sp. NRS-1564]|uniref:hypothetical protein n=1 Tax=Pseudalkalibacillus sp. NRS-1564 TaxID=3233900 RepID=UPI003D265EB3
MKRDTTQANKKINDSFYKGQAPVNVDEKINEDFYGEEPAQFHKLPWQQYTRH